MYTGTEKRTGTDRRREERRFDHTKYDRAYSEKARIYYRRHMQDRRTHR